MLCLEVELLTGRYTATRFNDRAAVEWPPHPARLFSAMVAVWADADPPDVSERAALEWFERLSPPELSCSSHQERAMVTHYVPDNDVSALARDVSSSYEAITEAVAALDAASAAAAGPDEPGVSRARRELERVRTQAATAAAKAGTATGRETPEMVNNVLSVLPDRRGRQGRMYPTALPDDPVFFLQWPAVEPGPERQAVLDGLLARVGRLGHSSTFVSCRIVGEAPHTTLAPVDQATGRDDEVVLRVPGAGSVERLERAFAAHEGREPRTLPAATAVYRRPSRAPVPHPRSVLGGEWLALGLPPDRRLALTRSLNLTRAVRNALLAHAEQPPPEVISGHRGGGGGAATAPSDRAHLAVLPLANVGHAHATNAILGVALLLPREITDQHREAVFRSLANWQEDNGTQVRLSSTSGQPIEFRLTATSELPSRKTLERQWWFGPGGVWRTVTPIALDHFPGDLRHRRTEVRTKAEREAEQSIRQSCLNVDLPAPVSVTLSFVGLLKGVPAARASRGDRRWSGFPAYRTGASNQPRVCIHAEIVFGEEVEGPLVLGAGRYLGYGLCLPARGKLP